MLNSFPKLNQLKVNLITNPLTSPVGGVQDEQLYPVLTSAGVVKFLAPYDCAGMTWEYEGVVSGVRE